MRQITKGATDQSTIIRILDSNGNPVTNVTSASAGLALQYRREGGANVALTESDLAAIDSAHADGGMIHIGNGYYRVDLPDAAVAAGADGVLTHGAVTGGVIVGSYHELVDAKVITGVVHEGTAQAVAADGLTMAAAASFSDDDLVGAVVQIVSATTGAGQSRYISAQIGDVLTVDPPWNTALTGTVVYRVWAAPPAPETDVPTVDVDPASVRSAVGLAAANLDAQLGALPTAAENAAQARVELATELARIDVATSTRASQASVDDVPTNAELAAALAALNDLSAADIRTAVGLATGNLDVQLGAIAGYVDNEITALAAAVAALPNANAIATALLDLADAIEAGVTLRGAQRAILAMVAGAITGAETTTPTIENPAGDTTRVTMTTDANGNRSGVTLNV